MVAMSFLTLLAAGGLVVAFLHILFKVVTSDHKYFTLVMLSGDILCARKLLVHVCKYSNDLFCNTFTKFTYYAASLILGEFESLPTRANAIFWTFLAHMLAPTVSQAGFC